MPCRFASICFFVLIFAAALPASAQDEKSDKKEEAPSAEEVAKAEELLRLPNFVLIIADDLAWDDSSPYGHESIMTPNLQRLADGGMRFDNAILTASSCSPSRASILTGRYPHQTDAEELHWPLPKEQVTFVEKLKEKGYWTGAAGKWHLGEEVKDRFDVVKDVDTSGFQLPAGDAATAGNFEETLEGDAKSGAADWVPLMRERDRARPFFLWLAALDPHRPYDQSILEEGALPDEIRVPPYHPDTPAVRADYQQYYDEITRLDRFVGEVLDELEEQKIADKTLVLFISDNGRPFPRDKTTLYDSGIKTPMIARWPGTISPGSVCPRLVSSIDIAGTFLSLAKIEKPGITFEGVDFSPLFSDPERPIRDYVFAEKNWHDYEDHARAVRNERYKYIRNYFEDLPLTPPADVVRCPTYLELVRLHEKGKLTPAQSICFSAPRPAEELYDLKLDPHEIKNLAADERYSPLLDAMRSALADWESRTKDAAPELRTADEFDRLTGMPTSARIRPRLPKKEMVEQGLAAP